MWEKSKCTILPEGHGHRRQGASFRGDRDSGIPRQVSTPPQMRVDFRQVRALGRRKNVGTKELDSLVLHTGTQYYSTLCRAYVF